MNIKPDPLKVLQDPCLQDLPFQIETDERGRFIMTPVNDLHGAYQLKIGMLLKQLLPQGQVVVEIAVTTRLGVKVPDVAWCSAETFKKRVAEHFGSALAPEICVEVLSPENTLAEMDGKRALFFEQGAREVWICDQNGSFTFYLPDSGQVNASTLAPDFPANVTL